MKLLLATIAACLALAGCGADEYAGIKGGDARRYAAVTLANTVHNAQQLRLVAPSKGQFAGVDAWRLRYEWPSGKSLCVWVWIQALRYRSAIGYCEGGIGS